MTDYQAKMRVELLKKQKKEEYRLKWYFEQFGIPFIQRPIIHIKNENNEETNNFVLPNFSVNDTYVIIEEDEQKFFEKKEKLKYTAKKIIHLKPSTIMTTSLIIKELAVILENMKDDKELEFALLTLKTMYYTFLNNK